MTTQNSDRVGYSGVFESIELESQYRHSQIRHDSAISQVFVAVNALSCLVFISSDYDLFGTTPRFFWLLGARAAVILVSTITLARLRGEPTPGHLDRTVFVWGMVIALIDVYVTSTRPSDYIGHVIVNVGIVLLLYGFLSLPLTIQAAPALLMSLGNILLFVWLNPPTDSKTGTAAVFAFVVVNILGGETSRRMHRWRREQFGAYLRETELRRALERAMAEIRTLRGIIPICAHCKRVRDDAGYWQQVEVYVGARTDAKFSHGVCPDCLTTYYADYVEP